MIENDAVTELPPGVIGDDQAHALQVYKVELGMQNEELRRVQRELEVSRAKYFDLYDTAIVCFCEIGGDGLIRQSNQAAARLLQVECHELVGKPFINFVHREDLPIYQRLCRQIEETGAAPSCELCLKPNGKNPSWVDLQGAWCRDDEGVGEMRLAFSDTNDRKQLEIHLRHSQKMQAFGQLAGGVAHDFNNILATILMQLDVLKLEPGQSEEKSHGLQQIRADALRATDLTRQLLTFSRRQVPQFRELDLNAEVRKLAIWSRRIIGDHVTLDVCLAPKPLITLVDAGMLDQIVMNLLGNAIHAMPSGGGIKLDTEERILTHEDARSMPEGRPGRYAVLTITDTGCGIAPEILPHIFEPFFTTKDVGKGTGLGLATVFGIVQQHQGLLTVQSEVGHGTSFRIFLPASAGLRPHPTEPAAAATTTKFMGGRETILLVEDQTSLRRLTGLLLEGHGYRVLYAIDGVDALEVCERHPERIDLLLTDTQMPRGIDGHELADRLVERCPDLRVIIVSASAVATGEQGLSLPTERIFLGKPFLSGELLETVRSCLDR